MQSKKIAVVGAAIMDVIGFSDEPVKIQDTTPGKLKVSAGGVGRNIAENLARLGLGVSLVAAFGDDKYSRQLIRQAEACGIDVSNSLFLEDHEAALFLAIMDEDNDLVAGIAILEIIESLNRSFLEQQKTFFEGVDSLVIETNLPFESIDYLSSQFPNATLFLDAVSVPFAKKVKKIVHRFDVLKANVLEAEALTDRTLITKEEILSAGKQLVQSGIKEVYITMGKEGVVYCDAHEQGFLVLPPLLPLNTIGAGDSFMAGLVMAKNKGLSTKESAKTGAICSRIAIMSQAPVNPEMSFEKVEMLLEEFREVY